MDAPSRNGKPWPAPVEAVLFDLDGTLLDSAPDLHAALVEQCVEEGAKPPPYTAVREVVSRGARAVLRCAFSDRGEAGINALVPRYLSLYQSLMSQNTRPFDGIEALLQALGEQRLPWGIVTNKAGYLTEELLVRIGWVDRAGTLVSGDTLAVAKPDPAPVLLACERLGVNAAQCLFVGDDQRDVQAGNAAGCYTVAAGWGYLNNDDPQVWQADCVLDHPAKLADRLRPARASA